MSSYMHETFRIMMDFSVYIFMIYYCNIMHVCQWTEMQGCIIYLIIGGAASPRHNRFGRNLLEYPRLFYAYQKKRHKKKEEGIHQLHLKPNFIVSKDIVNHFAGNTFNECGKRLQEIKIIVCSRTKWSFTTLIKNADKSLDK